MSRTLTIGIIGTRGIPNRYGGFEAFAEELSVRLVRRGHRVVVYVPHDHPWKEDSYRGVGLVRCHDPSAWLGAAGQFVYDLLCNLNARRNSCDLLLHLGYTSDSVWYRLWSPRAAHLCNMDGMEWQRAKYPAAVRTFLKRAEQWAARRSDLLVADSPVIRDYLASQYPTPVRFISYGATVQESFRPETVRGFGVEPGRYDLLVARMEPENNIRMALEARGNLGAEIPLLVFGNATSYGRKLQKEFGGAEGIRFPGSLYDTGKMNALRHFSRYYIHGHSAGGTNPSLLEAMACGCRIVAHDNAYNRAVLGGSAGYYTDAGSLSDLLTYPPGRIFDEWTRENLAIIRTRHDWERITTEYEEAFRTVTEG